MCKNEKKCKNLHFYFEKTSYLKEKSIFFKEKFAQMNKKQYLCSEIKYIVVK